MENTKTLIKHMPMGKCHVWFSLRRILNIPHIEKQSHQLWSHKVPIDIPQYQQIWEDLSFLRHFKFISYRYIIVCICDAGAWSRGRDSKVKIKAICLWIQQIKRCKYLRKYFMFQPWLFHGVWCVCVCVVGGVVH